MSTDGPAGDPVVFYRIGTVRIGVQATLLTLLVLIALPFTPGHGRIDLRLYLPLILSAAGGAALAALLPWRWLFDRGYGTVCLYAWSVGDILLITYAVLITGGSHSDLYAIYGLTTIFFAASYPLRGQALLLLFTCFCYTGGLALRHDLASPAALLIRLGSLVLVAYLGGFLSRRLLQEMTAHHANAERLRASEARFRALVQNAVDVVMVLDPAGRVQYVTPTVERVMGYGAADLTGTDALAIVHPHDRDQTASEFRGVLTQPGVTRTRELLARHVDGSWRTVEATFANLLHEPGVGGIVVTYHDVTERTAFQQQLSHQAFHDGLTGLPNRAAFRERLESALAGAGSEQSGVAVLFIDLDRFKVVNDSLGHEVGDQVLVAVAERLRGLLSPQYTVARLGGDEFTVLLEAVASEAEVAQIAEALLALLAQPVAIDRHHLTIGGSIGVALARGDERPDDLLRHADLALYRAKEAGKAQYAVFDAELGARARQRLELEADLRRALEVGELCLYYQPQIDLQSGRLVGVEALSRWRHPQRGLVPPDRFIPVAEETGLIVPLGRWVLEQACREVAGWRRSWPLAASLRVSVNVSPLQFHQPFLVEEVAEALQAAGLPPDALELEITESALMRDDAAAARSIAALHELGVSLAIDDFGTGYSALGYLRRYPVHTLKIDRAFVADIADDPGAAALADGIVRLARTLGLQTVAEGVETPAQARVLRAIGDIVAQGYLFARPLPARELEALIAAGECWPIAADAGQSAA